MSQSFTIPIKYGPNGCQVRIGDKICQETQTLEIIKEFNRVYQGKLREISSIGGGDNLQLKINLQQDWIRDLTQQNEMLVKIVEELEKEAVDRVVLLEKRLETSSITSDKKLEFLESDVRSLVKFIKRIRDGKQWNIDGLRFYTVNPDTFSKKIGGYDCDCTCTKESSTSQNQIQAESQSNVKRKENVRLKLSDSLQQQIIKTANGKMRVIVEVIEKQNEPKVKFSPIEYLD